MKNKRRKLLAFALALVLLMGSTLGVHAASKSVVSNVNGFRCTGSGTVTSTFVSASFNASALPGTPVQPDEAYSSHISALVKDRYGNLLLNRYVKGTTSGSLYYSPSGTSINYADIGFDFMGSYVGGVLIYA